MFYCSIQSIIGTIFNFILLEELHDAVLLWAYGVNKTVEKGFSPDDGAQITQNILNTTIQGVMGPVAIDENGDRLPNLR